MVAVINVAAWLVALLFATRAAAQVCPGGTGPTIRESLATEPDIIACAPAALGGTGTRESIRVSAAGLVAWHWCPSGATGWSLVWMAATRDQVLSAIVDVPALAFATDKLAAVRAFADKHATTPLDDPSLLPLWCPHWTEMVASRPPQRVSPWWVRKAPYNAIPAGTRPTYSVVSGVLKLDGGRVLEFASCNCAASKFPASGPVTHCSVLNQTARLALCEPRP